MKLFRKIYNAFRLRLNRRYNIEIFRQKGVQIGEKTGIQTGCYLDPAYPYLIRIGSHCVLSNNVTLLAHDASVDRYLGICKVGKVEIKDYCFIGINATVLPNVTIGPNSIVAAGSVVTHDVPPSTVAAGNPARVICTLEEFKARHESALREKPSFPRSAFEKSWLPESLRKEIFQKLSATWGYLVGRK